jgi:hypothetical protein
VDRPFAVDLSHHQVPSAVPWERIAESSSLAIVRTSYGTMRDRQTALHVQHARDVGLQVGIYHFFRVSQPWRDQLAVMRRQADAAGYGAGDVWPALDVEADPLPTLTPVSPSWQEDVRSFLDSLRDAFGGAIVYITQREYGMLGKPAWLLDHPIWCAHYTTRPQPATPGDRPWLIWQHRVGPYDPEGAGGYYDGGAPQLDQNRLAGPLPIVGERRPFPETRAPVETEGDDECLHRLSTLAIAQSEPYDVADLRAERDREIAEDDDA